MASSLSPLEIRRLLGRGNWSTPTPFGPDGWKFVNLDGEASVIVSVAPHDGDEWIHASLAREHRMPDYARRAAGAKRSTAPGVRSTDGCTRRGRRHGASD